MIRKALKKFTKYLKLKNAIRYKSEINLKPIKIKVCKQKKLFFFESISNSELILKNYVK